MPPELAGVERFARGDGIARARPGDFILVRGTSWRSRLVSMFERLRFRRAGERQYAHWNHAALVVSFDGAIVEAGTDGVVVQHIEKYRNDEYHYVSIDAPPPVRWKAVRLASSRVGTSYGTLAVADAVLTALAGKTLGRASSSREVCAGLVARSLELAQADARVVTPGDLAKYFRLAP
jgi:hypothetical protein